MTEPGRLGGARDLCRAGRFADAERELRAMLARSPTDADVLQLLGIVAASLGRVEESVAWFDRAKAARPGSLALMHNRAQSLLKLGRLAEARTEAQSIAASDPSNAPARDLLARILHEEAVAHHAAGRYPEAIDAYRRAIAGGLAAAQVHGNLANALRLAGRLDEALGHFAEAARLDPGSARALAAYGGALNDAARAGEAVAPLERAVALDPANAAAHNFLGAAYFALGRPADAVQSHRRALALEPDFDQACNNLGNALAASGQGPEALEAFREVLSRNAGDVNALCDMGAVLQEMGDLEGARASLEAALRVRPDFPQALNNLGLVTREEGRIDEAAALFERCLELQPGHAGAAHNLALAHLARGRFAEGWRLHEARFRVRPPATVWRALSPPVFSAADFGRGHRVAIWREQGIGDQILFATTLADLESRAERFALEIDARLVPAIRRAHPAWPVAAPQDSPALFAECDRHAPLATMAGLLRPTAASFDAQPRAFLLPDADRASRYRARLAAPGRRVVGISWRSFQRGGRGHLEARKSAPLAAFAGLAARADLRLLDLQYGDTAGERARFEGELARIDDLDLFNDLDGVLAAIEACDVVVTTSNVTAHLAGAAGKRALLVYLRDVPPFHYWAAGPDGRCLWYPSVRIVTGAGLDTWPAALERIDELVDR